MAYKVGDTIQVDGKDATILQVIHTPKKFGAISEEPSASDLAKQALEGTPALEISYTEYLIKDSEGIERRVKANN